VHWLVCNKLKGKPVSFSRSTLLHGVKESSWPVIPLLENSLLSQRYEHSARCCSLGPPPPKNVVPSPWRVMHVVQQNCLALKIMVLGFIETCAT